MKIGIVIYSNDAETVWNAFRYGNYALGEGDEVKAFLLAKGVECESIDTDEFKVTEQMRTFVDNGGSNTCLWNLSQDPTFQRFRDVSTLNDERSVRYSEGK